MALFILTSNLKISVATYKAHLVRVRTRQSCTMTDLQWLSSKVWVVYLESLQELLGTSLDMEERSLAKSLADEGRMLMARSGGSMRYTFLGKPK